jgi:hypothetical protein
MFIIILILFLASAWNMNRDTNQLPEEKATPLIILHSFISIAVIILGLIVGEWIKYL